MKFSSLPPVRRAVPLKRGKAATRISMEQFFADRRITLYASGTAALSRAIAECAVKTAASAPEVILPAYGCPDLVAACVHASVFPRLVDVAPSGWSYDAQGLETSVSSNTVAIVAVNLLGLGDSAADLHKFCQTKRISLIQDSAQYLPRASIEWPGDYVVLSFGRGKPMNLLHGGALIAPAGSGEHSSITGRTLHCAGSLAREPRCRHRVQYPHASARLLVCLRLTRHRARRSHLPTARQCGLSPRLRVGTSLHVVRAIPSPEIVWARHLGPCDR